MARDAGQKMALSNSAATRSWYHETCPKCGKAVASFRANPQIFLVEKLMEQEDLLGHRAVTLACGLYYCAGSALQVQQKCCNQKNTQWTDCTQWTIRPLKNAKIQTKTHEMDVLDTLDDETLQSHSSVFSILRLLSCKEKFTIQEQWRVSIGHRNIVTYC